MSYRDDEEHEEQDEENEQEGPTDIKDREHMCFLVDASPNMFEVLLKPEDMGGSAEDEPKSSFNVALSTIADFMKKRIVSGSKDEFAVIFYNTRESKNDMNHAHVYVFMKRDQPSADSIHSLHALTDAKFQRTIGSLEVDATKADEAVASCDALKCGLWSATDALQAKGSKFARHRIIMFSNTADPFSHLTSKSARAQYRQLVLDRCEPLKELGTTLRFFPLIAARQPFDMAAFWLSLMARLPDPDDEYTPNPASQLTTQHQATQVEYESGDVMQRLQCLADYMKRCLQKRRATGTLRWSITHDTVISCQVFDLMVEATKPYAVKLRATDNAPLSSLTANIVQEGGAILQRVEHKAFVPEKGAATRFPKVVFSVDEVAQVKYYLPPGLVLLGFKPRSCLKEYHNVRHSSFLRPTERDVKGSTPVFRALLAAMLKRDNIAICRYVRTRRAEPRLVALLPQAEVLDSQGYQVWAEGLHMIQLPFKEDIRTAEEMNAQLTTASPDQVEAARQVVHSLQYVDFTVGAVSNPVIDRHFQVLECLAEGPDIEPPSMEEFQEQDPTLPPPEIDDKAGQLLEAFKQSVGLSDEAGGAGSKRKASGPADNVSTAEAFEALGGVPGWQEMVRENRLAKLTVPDLKVYLKYNKLPMSGNKADIVERITKHVQGGIL